MTPLQMKQTPEEVKKKSFCLKMKGEHLQLDENHNYFYRVQGQEGVSGIEWFDFALLTDPHLGLNGFFVQRIYLNNNQSESEWLPKLTEFYFNHLLPSSSKITLPHSDYCFYIFQYLLIYKYTWLFTDYLPWSDVDSAKLMTSEKPRWGSALSLIPGQYWFPILLFVSQTWQCGAFA